MLRCGTAYSRCSLRCVKVACGPTLAIQPGGSSIGGDGLAALSRSALTTSQRCKASTLRIANRKRVEMFVGKRYHLPTRLRVAAPDIAQEWDHEQNPMHLYPEIVSIGHMYPVFWKCRACGASYQMSVEKRVVRGGGCPVCEDRATNQSIAQNTATLRAPDAPSSDVAEMPLLAGEQDRSLRPKRSTMLNLRTKY